jgi:hypothetical protein
MFPYATEFTGEPMAILLVHNELAFRQAFLRQLRLSPGGSQDNP